PRASPAGRSPGTPGCRPAEVERCAEAGRRSDRPWRVREYTRGRRAVGRQRRPFRLFALGKGRFAEMRFGQPLAATRRPCEAERVTWTLRGPTVDAPGERRGALRSAKPPRRG